MPAAAQLLILLAVLVVFWMVVMRPARNQQRRVTRFQDEVKVGDEVVISAGIFGTVRSVDETTVALEVAPGTVLTVARQVVVRRAETAEPIENSPAADTADGVEESE